VRRIVSLKRQHIIDVRDAPATEIDCLARCAFLKKYQFMGK